ncbi:MAG: FAD-dependent oxidoreductase [Spirochaetia bacterium]
MKYHSEAKKEIPVVHEVEVLVVGGGPAGFAAAVSSARLGAQTLLVENNGAVGGIATSGLMSHWTGATEGPMYSELLHRSKDTDKDWNYFGDKVLHGERIIHPEKLKLEMLNMLEEAGAEVQLYTLAADVIKEENQVRGIITESKSGREAIYAKIVIDATGDGDVAYKAGADYVKGREHDGKMQPVSIMFKVGGVDFDRAVFPGEFEDDFQVEGRSIQALAKQQLPHPIGHVLLYPSSMPGIVSVNMTNSIDVDATNVRDISRGEHECRKQIPLIVDFLRTYIPGYEECFLVITSSLLGVRETRHFVGLYTLTAEDIQAARLFDDWIVTRAYFNFDVHNMSGSGMDETGVQKDFKQSAKYSIPLGCFIPEKLNGLLLAGRNISGTHLAHSNYRAMPTCINMGQGVGTVAAQSLQEKVEPRDVDIRKVQQLLMNQGVQV